MEYLKEAAKVKPDNCTIEITKDGVLVDIKRNFYSIHRLFEWHVLEPCRINPIIMFFDEACSKSRGKYIC